MIHPQTKEAYRLFHDGTLAFTRAEQQGIRVDMEYCEKKKQQLTEKINRLEQQFFKTNFYKHWAHSTRGKVNIHSNVQLSNFLYKTKKLKPVHTTMSGQGSTDEEALTQLLIPELSDLIKIRELKKIRDTYLDAFIREQVNGYIHPSFNLHLVVTYRSSSDRPNLQNIPKRDKEARQICRKALFPRPGHQLMEVDYKALEVQIAACYHQDPTMLKYLTDPKSDMHGDMAQQIFFIDKLNKRKQGHKTLRDATKNGFVFPQFYGDYYKNCAMNLACTWGGLPNGRWGEGRGIQLEEGVYLSDHFAKNKIRSIDSFIRHIQEIESNFWGKRFPVYRRWKEKWYAAYEKNGYIDMKTGFRCSGVMRRNEAINYPVQGAAFHCLLWSFIQLDHIMRQDGWKTRLISQTHDDIVLDVYPAEKDLVVETLHKVMTKDLRETWPWVNVPLGIEISIGGIDESWADLEVLEKKI